jgi:hypothetical protein
MITPLQRRVVLNIVLFFDNNSQEPSGGDVGGRFYVFIFIVIWSEMLN